MKRRFLMGAGAALAATSFAARAQHSGHGPALRPAPSSPHPFHNLFQGGAPHHLTPDQRAQRVSGSPAPAGAPGRTTCSHARHAPAASTMPTSGQTPQANRSGAYGHATTSTAYAARKSTTALARRHAVIRPSDATTASSTTSASTSCDERPAAMGFMLPSVRAYWIASGERYASEARGGTLFCGWSWQLAHFCR